MEDMRVNILVRTTEFRQCEGRGKRGRVLSEGLRMKYKISSGQGLWHQTAQRSIITCTYLSAGFPVSGVRVRALRSDCDGVQVMPFSNKHDSDASTRVSAIARGCSGVSP